MFLLFLSLSVLILLLSFSIARFHVGSPLPRPLLILYLFSLSCFTIREERPFFFFGMRVVVHVREKVIPLQCGDGTQQVMWLGNAAMIHYDATFGKKFGPPVSIRKEGGVQCDLEARVCDVLDDNQHVFVTLEQDEADD